MIQKVGRVLSSQGGISPAVFYIISGMARRKMPRMDRPKRSPLRGPAKHVLNADLDSLSVLYIDFKLRSHELTKNRNGLTDSAMREKCHP
jgi:hypothetical protein